MPLLRRAPLVRVTVDLYPGEQVAVSLEPKPSRWPEHEGSDRLVIPLALAALALHHAEETEVAVVRGRLHEAARALARGREGGGAEDLLAAVAGFEIVPAERVGNPRIELLMERSSRGPLPSLAPSAGGVTDVADAAAAAFAVCLAPRSAELQLAAALAVEGLLGWYSVDNPRRKLTEEAVAFSVRHAASRLAEQGHEPPPELVAAIDERRKIPTMPGEA
jgi:hypothetical protein